MYYNWKFNWRQAGKIKKQQSPHTMKVQTDLLKSNCVLEIQQDTWKKWRSLKSLAYKAGIKDIQHAGHRVHRVGYGADTIKPNPVFTSEQQAEAKEFLIYFVTAAFFLIAESSLYFLVAGLFLPGAGDYLKTFVAVFLALLNMLALDYGLTKHFACLLLLDQPGVSSAQRKIARHKRAIGYVLIILAMGAIIYSGLARLAYLENVDTTGLPPEQVAGVHRASYFTAVVTMLTTLLAAIYMGVRKLEQSRHGHAYSLYTSWRRINIRQNRCHQRCIKEAIELRTMIEARVQKYIQLVIRLKELLPADYEHDKKYLALDQEYVHRKGQPGFEITEAIYLKYAPLQVAHEELFRYAVLNSPEIHDRINLAESVLTQVEGHVERHMPEAIKAKQNESHAAGSHHLNGMSVLNTSVIALLLCSLLGACTQFTSEKHRKNAIALVDISNSRDSSIVGWYCGSLNSNVISHLLQRDRIVVLPVDYGSETFGTALYTKDFSSNRYHNELGGLQSDKFEASLHRDSLKAACTACTKAVFAACMARKNLANGSDIIGALRVAKNYCIPGDTNIIVIFSDMKQYTYKGHINLERPFSTKDYPALLAEMNHLNLEGVNVLVITGDMSTMPSQQFEALRGLWTQYFKQCSATLIDYSSAAGRDIGQYSASVSK